MFRGNLVAAVVCGASFLSLFGCETRVTNLVVPPGSAARAAPHGPVVLHQTALAGRTMRVDITFSVNPDCSSRELPVLHIITQPTQGTAQIVNQNDYPRFPPANIRSQCNNRRMPGVAVLYTPNPGYQGADMLAFEIISDEGSEQIFNDYLTVKTLGAAPGGGDGGEQAL